MTWTRWLARAVLAQALLISCWPATGAAAAPPLEHFFENSAFGGAVLSPSGRYLAARISQPGRRTFLAVIDLETKKAQPVAEYSDADVGFVQWVNDKRLVFNLRDSKSAAADQDEAPGLFAVNRDGTGKKQLADRNWERSAPQPWNTFLLRQRPAEDSDFIYVTKQLYDQFGVRSVTHIRRLDTVSGVAKPIVEPPELAQHFMLDFHGEPRLATVRKGNKVTYYYREPANGYWRAVSQSGAYGNDAERIDPVGFGPDGTLYVSTNAGADTSALYAFDLATGKVRGQPLLAMPGYDFDGDLVSDGRRLLGAAFVTDTATIAWFDPAMQAVQKTIDAAAPGMVNLLSVPSQADSPWVLVESFSDMQPPRYSLYNRQSGKFDPVGATYPLLRAADMGRQQPLRFKARDGRMIPGLLTLPHGGAKPAPMVVLVHGGPWMRGHTWGWEPESQFLASRGYAVLEIEFRGGSGLGLAHLQAGMKQWGLAMQDDLADGTRWAIAQGYADPQRICIAGASYGGYATLMGLIKDPDLYRCGVAWAGVTDIDLMYTGTWFSKSDLSDTYLRYGMPLLVGDQVKDAAQFKATSPLQQAARLRQPLLLAYGRADERVPIYNGKKLYDALRSTNQQVEWVEYSDEGHGWSLPKNRIDFWGRVEKFLARNIGPQAVQPAAANAP